jgi:uncharacterized membrane protein YfcA
LILGYLGAVLIGVVLGLIGGGGSILTVPILVYLIGIEPLLATSYSLFVVGATAGVGTLKNAFKGFINFKVGGVFAIPSFIAVYITRRYVITAIPKTIMILGGVNISKDTFIMLLFATLMAIAAYFMIVNRSNFQVKDKDLNYLKISLDGLLVGFLTGLVGAGGGFLIIPALVILANLDMKNAIATSLFIITVKSLFGFLGDVQSQVIDWSFLLTFTLFAVSGIFIGMFFGTSIDSKPLKKIFGWFVLTIAIFIIVVEFLN